jgi:hypothetical protein
LLSTEKSFHNPAQLYSSWTLSKKIQFLTWPQYRWIRIWQVTGRIQIRFWIRYMIWFYDYCIQFMQF